MGCGHTQPIFSFAIEYGFWCILVCSGAGRLQKNMGPEVILFKGNIEMTPAVASQTVRAVHRPNRAWDRVFFSTMVLLILGTVLFGFARTYFLAGMVTAPLPNKLIHVHGAVFTIWIVLLIVQTALISAKQVKVHRTLGMFGFGWAVLMLGLGLFAAVDALRRGSGPLGLDAKTFFVIPITSLLLFAIFVFSAYRMRSKPEAHKRLILIGTVGIIDAAVGRWPVALFQQHPPMQDLVPFGFLLLLVIFDLFSLHRVSKTTIWASALLVVVHLARVPLGFTSGWHAFADWSVKHL